MPAGRGRASRPRRIKGAAAPDPGVVHASAPRVMVDVAAALPITSAVCGTPCPRRHSRGGTGLGWLHNPARAALARASSRSGSWSAGAWRLNHQAIPCRTVSRFIDRPSGGMTSATVRP